MTRPVTLAMLPFDAAGRELAHAAAGVLDALPSADGHGLVTVTHDAGTPDGPAAALSRLLGRDGGTCDAIVVPGSAVTPDAAVAGRPYAVGVRQVRHRPGAVSPVTGRPRVELLIVQEHGEGVPTAGGSATAVGSPDEVAGELSVAYAPHVEAVVRYAFERARRTPARRLTLVHKHNILVHTGGLWKRVTDRVAPDFPDVEVEYLHVDAATMVVVTRPEHFAVVVTDALFADILAALGTAVGGTGCLTVRGHLDPARRHPALFHPEVTAADLWTVLLASGMALAEAGRPAEAAMIEAAVMGDLLEHGTADPSDTSAIGERLAARITR